MATSRIPAAVDAVVAALHTAGVKTWDGPVLTQDYANAVWVGYDADPDGSFEAVIADQQWAGLGAKAKNEIFDIVCAATALVGDGEENWAAARNAVFALFATVETALRTDPSLGQPAMTVAAVVPQQLLTEDGPAGAQARLVFHVHVQTRI